MMASPLSKDGNRLLSNRATMTPFSICRYALLLSLFTIQTEGQNSDTKGVMVPNVTQQVIQVDSSLKLACVFTLNSFNISWKLPDYLTNHQELSDAKHRLSFKWDRNETHSSSTMTLIRSRPRDTGHYGCYLTTMKWWHVKAFEIQQYIYVFSYKELVVVDEKDYDFDTPESLFKYIFKHGGLGRIPCKPTHPNVTVVLKRTNPLLADGPVMRDYESEKEIDLSDENTNWLLEPFSGLTVKNVSLDDTGAYECIGTMNNVTTRKYFKLIVSGIELVRLGDGNDPVEGSNVTLVCRSHMLSSPPQWAYFNHYTQQLQELDETSLPEGIQIVTKKLKVLGEEPFYESELRLTNITSNSKTTFHCQSKDDDEIISRQISFKVNEAGLSPSVVFNNQPLTSIIQLREGKPKNLTCYGLPEDDIHWIKNGIVFSGETHVVGNASILSLRGTANETGTYACRNKLGERYRHFTVTFTDGKFTDVETVAVTVSVVLFAILVAAIGIGVKLYPLYLNKKEKVLFPGAEKLLSGKLNQINPQMRMEEQTELLPYDKRWEFPKNRLKFGIQLGAGCFGRVVKADAIGIRGAGQTVKTVAVKMARSQANVAALEALVSELKILIHLGSHLNVVNLMGACTINITRGELFVIVEYCRHGNLQTYLINHRKSFVNLLDEAGNMKPHQKVEKVDKMVRNGYLFYGPKEEEMQHDPAERVPLKQSPSSSTISSLIEDPAHHQELSTIKMRNKESTEPESFWHYQQDPDVVPNQIVTTRDLVCWSFQVARGMEYLASKKVLHGDLAARNVLLGDDGVVKVADFGMARQMYYEGNYQKKGQGLMPVKWMAIESLTDRIFSSQTDVWSYGILIWELFSLGKVPYPGMEADHQLITQLQNGYRMDKPEFAPNSMATIMSDCWKAEPKERPTFSQLEERIGDQLESSVSGYYLDLNNPYVRLNEEKNVASPSDNFGLNKLLNVKNKTYKTYSQLVAKPTSPNIPITIDCQQATDLSVKKTTDSNKT